MIFEKKLNLFFSARDTILLALVNSHFTKFVDIGSNSKIIRIVFGIRSSRYLDAISVAVTEPYSAVLRIAVGIESPPS